VLPAEEGSTKHRIAIELVLTTPYSDTRVRHPICAALCVLDVAPRAKFRAPRKFGMRGIQMIP